tara:strand:- start:193 stop:1014 length:822 start_codon:yes stop_codon:yes gene_type:complete
MASLVFDEVFAANLAQKCAAAHATYVEGRPIWTPQQTLQFLESTVKTLTKWIEVETSAFSPMVARTTLQKKNYLYNHQNIFKRAQTKTQTPWWENLTTLVNKLCRLEKMLSLEHQLSGGGRSGGSVRASQPMPQPVPQPMPQPMPQMGVQPVQEAPLLMYGKAPLPAVCQQMCMVSQGGRGVEAPMVDEIDEKFSQLHLHNLVDQQGVWVEFPGGDCEDDVYQELWGMVNEVPGCAIGVAPCQPGGGVPGDPHLAQVWDAELRVMQVLAKGVQ